MKSSIRGIKFCLSPVATATHLQHNAQVVGSLNQDCRNEKASSLCFKGFKCKKTNDNFLADGMNGCNIAAVRPLIILFHEGSLRAGSKLVPNLQTVLRSFVSQPGELVPEQQQQQQYTVQEPRTAYIRGGGTAKEEEDENRAVRSCSDADVGS